MLNIWLFRISSILLLFNAFLVSTKLPKGLFSAKELGLWFAVGITCILALVKILSTKKNVIKITVIDILVCSFLIVLPIFSIFYQTKIINHSALLTQIAMGFAYISIRVLSANIRAAILVNLVIELLMILLCFHLLIAISQHFSLITSYYPRFGATGMFFNPGPFAIFTTALAVCILPVFLQQVFNKNYLNAAFYAILILISTYFIINSLSRSAWLGGLSGLFVGSILFLLTKFKWKISKTTRRFSFFMCLLIILPFFYWLYQYKADSATGRILAWKTTGLMLNDYWPAGVGLGNFAANYVDFQAAFFNQAPKNIQDFGNIAGDNRYAFNDILQIFSENGIVGLTLFIAILLLCGKLILESYKQHAKGIILLYAFTAAPLITILIAGLTAYPLSMLPISILFWFLIAILVSASFGKPIVNNNNTSQKFIYATILLIACSVFLYNGFNKLYAYKKWTSFVSLTDKEKKVEDLLLVFNPLNNNADYLNNIAQLYISKKQYKKAIPYLQRAISFSPYKGYYYSLGNCYEKIGDYDKAITQYKKIGDAIPNLIKPRYLIAKLYYTKKEYIIFKKLATETINFEPKINSSEVSDMKKDIYDMLNTLQLNP